MTYDPQDILARFHRALVREIQANNPEALTSPFSVAEIYQNLVPYRTHRDEIGVEMNGDYEHALLRLLAGEGDFLTIESRTARQEIREELDSPNPNTSLYRDFAAADVLLNPDKTDEALAAVEAPEEDVPELEVVAEEDFREGDEAEAPEEAAPESEEPAMEGGTEEEDDSLAGLTVAVSEAPLDEEEMAPDLEEVPTEAVADAPDAEAEEVGEGEAEVEPAAEAEGEAQGEEEIVSEELQGKWRDPSSWLEPSIETLRDEYEMNRGASLLETGDAVQAAEEVASGGLPFEVSVQKGKVKGKKDAPKDEEVRVGIGTESHAGAHAPENCAWCREKLPERPGVNFCPFCGMSVKLVPCPECGEELELNWRFCIACGTEVSS